MLLHSYVTLWSIFCPQNLTSLTASNYHILITPLHLVDLIQLSLRIGRHGHAHMHILLHCECQIASYVQYHNTIIVLQYQLEKPLDC